MSPTFHALDILCRVHTRDRRTILARMPATREEYAIHGAYCVTEIERSRDVLQDLARAERAARSARSNLRAAADLGDTGCANLLAMIA